MAHVEKRGAGRWVAIYPNPATKSGRGARSFSRKLDADRFLAVTLAAQLQGAWVDPAAGKVTVRAYGAAWLAARDIRPTTRERYDDYFVYINRLGDFELAALTPSILEAWQASMRKTLAASTTGTIRGVFAAVLKSAVRDRLIPASPMTGVRAPKVTRQLVRPLERAVVLDVADAMTDRYRAAVWLGAGCGLRRGEAFGMCRDRVNFLRREVVVDQQVVQVKGGPPYLADVKTAASVRTVPLPAVVADALAAHVARYGVEADGALFTTARGALVGRTTFGKAWARTGAPAGSRFHDLRHFYASTLIDAGASVKEVQARLGHATAAETLDTYAHLWASSEDSTRRIIDAAFAADVARSQRIVLR